MSKLGFIGLGHMGAPMALNLLKQYSLFVYDVNQDAIRELTKVGAIACTTLAEMAQQANVIITMLPMGEHVEKVCLGTDGLFAYAKPNTLFIDC